MNAQPFRTARSAWEHLVDKGGLDVADRDRPLIETLMHRLNPQAVSISDALDDVSVEGFLNAFFGTITPFVAMLRDLLQYFESAGATDGPDQWTLALGEGNERLEVDLDHFRRWTERPTATSHARHDVPILDSSQLWELRKHFFLLDPTATKTDQGIPWRPQPTPSVLPSDLASWLRAYDSGTYVPLPLAVQEAYRRGGVIADVAALLMEIYHAILAVAPTKTVLDQRGRFDVGDSNGDFWSVRNLRQFESDFWLKGRVLDLAAWLEAAPDRQQLVTDSLQTYLAQIPRRPARLAITLSDVEEILSLPIWKRRYELYSAWVLTSVLHALRGHSITLHHEDGVISFAFREKLMASVLSSDPPLAIFAEKRTAATGLVGHGRVGGVQPDYSFWTDTARCPLAVESKHYKRSSTSNFADALNDYSAALPDATVVLVNYGPVSPAVRAAIDAARQSRCEALGSVQPEDAKNRAAFEDIVRHVVGDPMPHIALPSTRPELLGQQPVLLIDVSGSMSALLGSDAARELVETLVREHGIQRTVAADERVLMEAGALPADIAAVVGASGSGHTSLRSPVSQLLERFSAVMALTDFDGARDLADFPRVHTEELRLGGAPIVVATVTK